MPILLRAARRAASPPAAERRLTSGFQPLASIRLQRVRIAAGLCAAALLLAACGSKGALYVPPPDQSRPDNATRR
jgi:hypothetical protein